MVILRKNPLTRTQESYAHGTLGGKLGAKAESAGDERKLDLRSPKKKLRGPLRGRGGPC